MNYKKPFKFKQFCRLVFQKRKKHSSISSSEENLEYVQWIMLAQDFLMVDYWKQGDLFSIFFFFFFWFWLVTP
jgi:hypothetical protein